jgi:hypothetical protein
MKGGNFIRLHLALAIISNCIRYANGTFSCVCPGIESGWGIQGAHAGSLCVLIFILRA